MITPQSSNKGEGKKRRFVLHSNASEQEIMSRLSIDIAVVDAKKHQIQLIVDSPESILNDSLMTVSLESEKRGTFADLVPVNDDTTPLLSKLTAALKSKK